MTEHDSTPEDIARFAAELRGQTHQDRKAGANREILDAIHPPEPEPERDLEAEEFIARLFAPKRADIEVIRRIHGTEEQ